jgi:hypothetical protein
VHSALSGITTVSSSYAARSGDWAGDEQIERGIDLARLASHQRRAQHHFMTCAAASGIHLIGGQ